MKCNNEIVFLDIDDTIADFSGQLNNLFTYYKDNICKNKAMTYGECADSFKKMNDEEYCYHIEKSNILLNLELLPNTFEYLQYCYDRYKLFFITARKWHSNSFKVTADWLCEKNILYDGLIITDLKDPKIDYIKKFQNIKLFIDDKYVQYKLAKDAHIKCLLKTTKANILEQCNKDERVDDLNNLITI